MISEGRLAAINRLTGACPSFPAWDATDEYEDLDGTPNGHAIVGALCRHLLEEMEEGRTDELDRVLTVAEAIMAEGDPEAVDLADTGVVEDLYNILSWRIRDGSRLSYDDVRRRLPPRCAQFWDAWEDFGNQPRLSAEQNEAVERLLKARGDGNEGRS